MQILSGKLTAKQEFISEVTVLGRLTDKLQFIGLTRMNINEKINGIINVQLMIINV